MTEVVRCQEAIANYVLDAGEPISYRALASQVGGSSSTRSQALAQFLTDNRDGVSALHVVVAAGHAARSTDPRARVIRIASSTDGEAAANSQIYGVYPSATTSPDGQDALEAMATSFWAQERKMRNDVFAKMPKHTPLTREAKAFYESDVRCQAATSRTDMGDVQGEEAVSMFDSIRATSVSSKSQVASTTSKGSFFKNDSATSAKSTATASSSAAATKGNGFFKSGASTTTAKPKHAATASAHPPSKAPETKRIDAQAMDNVLTVDSDDDDESDGDDAPKFVKTSSAASKPRSKRVMISDDEDEDFEEVVPVAKPSAPAKKPSVKAASGVKRKLNESPEPSSPEAARATTKRQRSEDVQHEEEEEPQAEEDLVPTGPIMRRQEVTTMFVDEATGYMTTKKTYQEVEVSVEELQKERAEAAQKKKKAQAAADAQKARAATAASKSSKAPAGPAKQKKLDFFFTRK